MFYSLFSLDLVFRDRERDRFSLIAASVYTCMAYSMYLLCLVRQMCDKSTDINHSWESSSIGACAHHNLTLDHMHMCHTLSFSIYIYVVLPFDPSKKYFFFFKFIVAICLCDKCTNFCRKQNRFWFIKWWPLLCTRFNYVLTIWFMFIELTLSWLSFAISLYRK